MAQVTVEINGKPYTVGCEDGQEGHLRALAARLMLMGALLLSDELEEARARLAHAQKDLARVQSDYARAEARAVLALDAASKRIEALAAD